MVAQSIPADRASSLRHDYLSARLPTSELLQKYNCCWRTLHNTLDRFGIPRRGLLINSVDDSFFDEWSPESAWALGLWITDGSVGRCGNHHSVRIGFSDEQLIKTVHLLMRSASAISFSSAKNHWSFNVTSRRIFDRLRELGVTENKTHRIKLPDCPAAMRSHLVRGIFDGDGGFYLRHREGRASDQIYSSFTSCCLSFIESLYELIYAELGFCGSIRKASDSSCYILRFYHGNTLKLAEWMYGRSDRIRYEAKFVKFSTFLS